MAWQAINHQQRPLSPVSHAREAKPVQQLRTEPYDARPEHVLEAARKFLRDGDVQLTPQGGAQRAAPTGSSTSRIDASHHMVLERLSLEHSQQLSAINDHLQRLQEEHRVLLDKYEDLQVSSALQMKEILARRDAILDSLRLETANRVAKEKVLQQATAVIQRLTGRKFTGDLFH